MTRSKHGVPTQHERDSQTAMLHVISSRLARYQGAPESRIADEAHELLERLWTTGFFPLRWGKSWLPGISISVTDCSIGFSMSAPVGPAKPSRYKRSFSRVWRHHWGRL